MNLITPAKGKQAAALVQDGTTVSCARPIVTDITADQVQRHMVDSGEGRDTDPQRGCLNLITPAGAPASAPGRVGVYRHGISFHGQTITHIDALSHYSWQGKLYNGKPASLITSREGAQTHSIEPACDGIITRAVLLDIPRIRGVSWLPPEEPVMPPRT